MYHDVSYLLSRLINGPLSLRQIYFASSNGPVPDLAYQVDFPRLEIVLEGEFIDTWRWSSVSSRRCAVRPCWWLEFSTMASPRHDL